jgi:hypothetical protein
MSLEKSQVDGNQRPTQSHGPRIVAILVLLLIGAYVLAVLEGLPKERRIDAATLGIIGIGVLIAAILFRPDILERVTRLEVAGWKVEIEKRQDRQDKQLDYMRLILPVLLPTPERKHLLNLANHKTKNYRGNHELRTELRRLRSLGLIKMRPDKRIGDITNDLVVDLDDYVELTRLGEEWVDRITEFEADDSRVAENSSAARG